MSKTHSLFALGAATVLLVACETTPPVSNVINVRPDANGGFSGVAGGTWSDDEIIAKMAERFCGGNTPSQITIQEGADGNKQISGSC